MDDVVAAIAGSGRKRAAELGDDEEDQENVENRVPRTNRKKRKS